MYFATSAWAMRGSISGGRRIAFTMTRGLGRSLSSGRSS